MITKLHTVVYGYTFSHRYDNFSYLISSGGPQANQDLCLSQLDQLVFIANKLALELSSTKDINMILYLDTFGRAPAGVFDGDSIWLGSYGQCTRTEILLDGQVKSAARYCLASMKMKDWPENKITEEILVLKLGVCLTKE